MHDGVEYYSLLQVVLERAGNLCCMCTGAEPPVGGAPQSRENDITQPVNLRSLLGVLSNQSLLHARYELRDLDSTQVFESGMSFSNRVV